MIKIDGKDGKANGLTMCGALSGGLAGFSMVHGWRELPFKFWSEGMKPDGWLGKIIDNPSVSPEEKVHAYYDHCKPLAYGAYYQIVARFKERFGTTDCFYLQNPYAEPVSNECFRNYGNVLLAMVRAIRQGK